jgi:hypothetical protein
VLDGAWVPQVIPGKGDEQDRDVKQIELNPRMVKQEFSHGFFDLFVSRDLFKKLPVDHLDALCCNS